MSMEPHTPPPSLSDLLQGQAAPPPGTPPLTRKLRVDGLTLNAPVGLIKRMHLNVLANGAYEGGEIALATALVRPGQRVLEFGGGIGIVSRHVAGITGPDRVLSVEANPAALATARDHLTRDGLGVAHLWGLVTAEGASIRALKVDPNNFLASQPLAAPEGPAAEVAPVHSLGALIRDWRPEVLIVDIEGGEVGLFGPTDLSGIAAVVLELHPEVIGTEGCLQVVRDLAAQGLLADATLVAGAVLGFCRAPASGVADEGALTALFDALQKGAKAQPEAMVAVAGALPESPLLALQAAQNLPASDPRRQAILHRLADQPATSLRARQFLAIDALGARDNALALQWLAPLPSAFAAQLSARAHMALQQPEQALPFARTAAEGLPWLAPVRLLHARAALATGDRAAARREVIAARRLDPETPGLTDLETRLQIVPGQP